MVGPESGTRYFSSTQVMPREMSQLQISTPSPRMASAWYPPPGNTSMATPVLVPCAGYTVIVGRLTLKAPPSGSPVSGLGSGNGSGAAPGQIGTCSWPEEGCQKSARTCEQEQ